MFRHSAIPILFVTATSACAASAQMSCNDVKYGNPDYHEKMDQLAKRANLPEQYWNRYHESFVRAVCSGDSKAANSLIDDGSISAKDAQDIAKVLGKAFKPQQRSESGKSYEQVKAKFLAMGACSACADNIAQYYTKRPNSTCGKLAKDALAGNANSIKEITTFPDSCIWKY